MASTMTSKPSLFPLSPISDRLTSSSSSFTSVNLWSISSPTNPRRRHRHLKHSLQNAVRTADATTTTTVSRSSKPNPPRRRETAETDRDAISLLNERIHRESAGKREASSRTAMDSKEAVRYIQLVKEQQQRGLQKLKGGGGEDGNGNVSYKVDPYSLKSGDYVVHKKVGVGRFVGIKFDVQRDSNEPIEYVFIEYADGLAKLPVKQASRFLYRYNLSRDFAVVDSGGRCYIPRLRFYIKRKKDSIFT